MYTIRIRSVNLEAQIVEKQLEIQPPPLFASNNLLRLLLITLWLQPNTI